MQDSFKIIVVEQDEGIFDCKAHNILKHVRCDVCRRALRSGVLEGSAQRKLELN
jgi:hypothetical protein